MGTLDDLLAALSVDGLLIILVLSVVNLAHKTTVIRFLFSFFFRLDEVHNVHFLEVITNSTGSR